MITHWYYYVGGLVVAIIVALLWEDSRDWLSETFEYIITFEWFGDVGDFFGSMFEGLGEFSIYGLVFGVLTVGFSYMTRYINLAGKGMGLIESMTQYMSPNQRFFWTIASYVGSFVAGYFMGKFFENTS
jgi:hypothetical protein